MKLKDTITPWLENKAASINWSTMERYSYLRARVRAVLLVDVGLVYVVEAYSHDEDGPQTNQAWEFYNPEDAYRMLTALGTSSDMYALMMLSARSAVRDDPQPADDDYPADEHPMDDDI